METGSATRFEPGRDADDLVEEAVALAHEWALEASELDRDDPVARQLRDLVDEPSAVDFTFAFADRVVRPDDDRTAARHLARIVRSTSLPANLPARDRVLLKLGAALAPHAPGAVMPLARRRLRRSVGTLVAAFQIASVNITGQNLTIAAGNGVSGGPLVAALPDRTVVFANSSGFTSGLFGDQAFTRTSAVGAPVSFVAGDFRLTIGLSLLGSQVSLNMVCTASGTTVLSVTDVQGVVTTTTTTAAPAAQELPRTGSSTKGLALFAGVLLGLGVAMVNEAALLKLRHRRRVR